MTDPNNTPDTTVEQVSDSDADFALWMRQRGQREQDIGTSTDFTEAADRIEHLLRKHDENAMWIDELEAALEYYANSIGDHGIRARAVLHGANK